MNNDKVIILIFKEPIIFDLLNFLNFLPLDPCSTKKPIKKR